MEQHRSHSEQVEASAFGYTLKLSGTSMVLVVALLGGIGILIWIIIDYMHTTQAAIAAQTQAVIAAQTQQTQVIQAAIAGQMEISRVATAEQNNLLREQQLITYRELRIQTALMAVPETQRGQIIDTDKLRQNLRNHLEATPYLSPPIMKGTVPPLRDLRERSPEGDEPW